jgi:hypothetical protein
MTGAAIKNLRTFRKLCGEQSMDSVVLVTTIWNHVADVELGIRRQVELEGNPNLWGDMLAAGARVMRYQNNRESALKIVSYLMQRDRKVVLAI